MTDARLPFAIAASVLIIKLVVLGGIFGYPWTFAGGVGLVAAVTGYVGALIGQRWLRPKIQNWTQR